MSLVTMRAKLTQDDIRRLVKGETPEERAMAARKICQRVDATELTAEERAAANGILEMIAQDAVVLVRRALAVTLRSSPNLPKSVAMRLAADIDSIAVPVLAASPVFTDAELVEIIQSQGEGKQAAIGARASVSSEVVGAIVEFGSERAVGITAANDGADFDHASYEKAFTRFSDSSLVMDSFVARSSLPLAFTEKLISQVSDEALERLVKRHALPPQLAVELAEATRERATVDLVDQAGVAPDMRHFVQQLQINGRLTPSLVLRAAFRGHIEFVEHAFAELGSVPHSKAWLLIHDAGPLGMKAIFDRTGLPSRLFPAIRTAIDTLHSIEMDNTPEGRIRFRKLLAERAFTRFQGVPDEDVEYILSRLDEDAISDQPAAARLAG
ncbi:MAG TPA: hypothetical protein DCQ53_04425 [Alphaproteobacteria bacterium]|nr:hypothetical protein [Alphaproteobacteria bacterium]